MELTPESPNRIRQPAPPNPGAMDPLMAGRAERDHPAQAGDPWPAMMDAQAPRPAAAAAAEMAIALEHALAQAGEVFEVAAMERVAGRAQPPFDRRTATRTA
jgi:hypothetical protein